MSYYEVDTETYRKSQTLGTIAVERVEQLAHRLANKDKFKPIPTHIPALNAIIGGFPVDEPFIMLLFAKEKIGKTTIAMDLADAWRAGGAELIYFQLEELGRQYADRWLASKTSVTKTDLRDLTFTQEQVEEMRRVAKELKESNKDTLYIQDDLFVLEAMIQEANKMGIKKIVFDNLTLFDLTHVDGRGEREKLSALGSMLVKYRNKEGMSFILVAHEGADDQAFGSSKFNKAADILIQIEFVYQEGTDEKEKPIKIPGQRCLHVKESRLCPEGFAYVTFDGNKNKIGAIVQVAVDSPEFLAICDQPGPVPQVVGLPLLGMGV